MTAALAHRGPDADGFHFDGPVGLGHRRLSVIDLAGSRQPLVSRRRRRRRRLQRRDLQLPRAARASSRPPATRFATQGDGEVLVARLAAVGPRAARPPRRHVRVRAVGPRAARALPRPRPPGRQAALLRVARRRARLRLGAEGAAAVPGPAARARPRRAGALPRVPVHPGAAQRLPRRAASCPPGHWLSVRDGKLATGAFWRPSLRAQARARRCARRSTASTRELARSVESMLVADVPLGAFVSGGVDSGLIAAMATRICPAAPIDTFNLGFTGTDVGSEHVEAARVARHIGSRHHCLMLAPDDVLPALDRWVDVFDEPFGDQAALPTMLLAEYARREVTVVLTGEGADEVFGGYSQLRQARARGAASPRVLGAPRLAAALARAPAAAAARARPHRSRPPPSRARAATRRSPTSSTSLLRREYFTDRVPASSRTARIADRAAALYAAVRFAVVPRPPARHRRAAVAARRPARQGRPRDDGVLAGGARARTSTTSSTAGARGSTAGAQDRRQRAQGGAEGAGRALPAARHRPSPQAGVHDAARALARARAAATTSPRRWGRGASPAAACSARRRSRGCSPSTRRAARTTRCGCGCC